MNGRTPDGGDRHECEAVDCTNTTQAGHLMCRSCWSRVPLATQRRVYDAWRGLLRGNVDAIETHQQAKADAIAAVASAGVRA